MVGSAEMVCRLLEGVAEQDLNIFGFSRNSYLSAFRPNQFIFIIKFFTVQKHAIKVTCLKLLMDFGTVFYESKDRVAKITLNRLERLNSINETMPDDIGIG